MIYMFQFIDLTYNDWICGCWRSVDANDYVYATDEDGYYIYTDYSFAYFMQEPTTDCMSGLELAIIRFLRRQYISVFQTI